MKIFLREKAPIESHLHEHFTDCCFILTLAYVFALLNQLNISMQGAGVTIVEAREKIKAF